MFSIPSPLAVPRTLASYILSGAVTGVAEVKETPIEEPVRPQSTPPAPVKTQDITFSDLHNAAFLLGKAAELASQDQNDVAEEYYQAALTGVLRAARDSDGDIGDRLSQHLAKALASARCPQEEDVSSNTDQEEEKNILEPEKNETVMTEERIIVAQVAKPTGETMHQDENLGIYSSCITLPHAPPHPSSMMTVSKEVVQVEESSQLNSSSHSSQFSSSRIVSSMAIRALDLAISMGVYLARTRLAEDVSRHLMRRWDDLDREYHLSTSFLGVASEVVKRAKKEEDVEEAMDGKHHNLLQNKEDGSSDGSSPSSPTSHLSYLWEKRPWIADFPLLGKDSSIQRS
ncbi:hypothetical protein BJ684DRAFT_20269 [Piptocephalis cylindrospora]|uniref:Uncharacterized protein n=1 Tax=Piptocephalis cylindrospora TaxID=1907219 RepID=A0A4P9Y2U0_9FUNG|nr:hypothetical protein BJ684DRAFT_20269 [Piptocephalis cylindrospora]|eukprot:RKP13228.1 hypothetical protein BJ684DRAFT_20269 [Piptocephalis cylindrospora]